MIKNILCDIEGTTTDIKFVHKVLFPYSKKNFPEFLKSSQENSEVLHIINSIKKEYLTNEAELVDVIDIINFWIKEDKKISQLKELQGLIWVDGYDKGEFKGHIYSEVKTCFEIWKKCGKDLYIYSSGSVFAQKLLFSHTTEGDLTPLLSGYFDTNIGHKREERSYQNIITELACEPGEILFLSDIEEELDAAKLAGMKTGHLNRDNLISTSRHKIYNNFDEIIID